MRGLAQYDHCTGCSACAAACPVDAIRMEPDEYGFLHPHVREALCVSCGKCGAVCPVGQASPSEEDTEFYGAHCKDPEDLRESTSGGVFGVLAGWVLDQGGAVYGAAYDDRLQVRHIRVTEREQLPRLRGAKYAQSDPGDTFRQARDDLKQGRWVLFSGAPCQIAGLNRFLTGPRERLISVDLVCHSVPAPKAWEKYLEYRRTQDGQAQMPVGAWQRSKDTGWVNYTYCSRLRYPGGRESLVPAGEDLYMRAFVGGLITNSACASCPAKGTGRSSDFTLGDFWGVEKLGLGLDVQGGVSAVLIHSARGKALWRALGDQLVQVPVTGAQILAQNPAIEQCAVPAACREEGLGRICQEGFHILPQLFPQKESHTPPARFRRWINHLLARFRRGEGESP